MWRLAVHRCCDTPESRSPLEAPATFGPLSIQINTILYKLSPTLIDRFLMSVAKAVSVSRAVGRISEATLQIGDCSPMATLNETRIAELTAMAQDAGLDHVFYRFFDANLGSAAGHNVLLRDFAADLLWIINPDTAASPYVLNEMLLRMGDSAYGFGDVGIVEARQIPIEHPKVYDLESGETSWATTACALLPRLVVKDVGDFDSETFFLYCDDVDYSWRVRLAGRKIVYAPSARLFHDKRTTPEGHYRASGIEEYYAAEAAVLMAYKYSRPDLVDTYLDMLDNGTDVTRKAAKEFRDRRDAGRLPVQLDPDHRVGEFPRPGLFAEHRY
jgi:GT2 family glycosyltransferase